MPYFVVIALDKPDSLALRLATRPQHLEWATTRSEVKFGGPFLDDNGNMIGSLSILEADSVEQVEEFVASDPYRQAGLLGSVDIRPWRLTVGAFA